VIDTATGKVLSRLPDSGFARVTSADNKTFLMAGEFPPASGDYFVRRHDLATGKELESHRVPAAIGGPSLGSPDRKRVACRMDSRVVIFEPDTRKVTPLPLVSVHDLAFTPDGNTLLTHGGGSNVRVWDATTGRERLDLAGEFDNTYRPALSPDGKTLAVAESWDEKRVTLWDTASSRLVRTFPLDRERNGVNDLSFSPDGKTLRAVHAQGLVLFWDVTTGKESRRVQLVDPARRWLELSRVHFSPDGNAAFSLETAFPPHHAGAVNVWDLERGTLARRTEYPPPLADWAWGEGRFEPVLMHGTKLRATAAGGEPRYFGIVNTSNTQKKMAASFDGRLVAAWELEEHVGVWEVASGVQVARAAAGKDPAFALAADNRTLLTAHGGVLTVWDIETGKERGRRQLDPKPDPFSRSGWWLAVTRDGRRVTTPLKDGTAVVWDLSPFTRKAAPFRPTDDLLAKYWEQLLHPGLAGYEAVWRMADAPPDQLLRILRAKLKPATAPDEAAIKRAIEDLDSDDFPTREAASKRLVEFGPAAVGRLKKAVDASTSAEVRRRGQAALTAVEKSPFGDGESLRRCRAIELLERIDTPDARRVMEPLAKGWASAPETAEAKAALERAAWGR
jgi:WD40 repeat protein